MEYDHTEYDNRLFNNYENLLRKFLKKKTIEGNYFIRLF